MDDDALKQLLETKHMETRRHFDVVAEQLKKEIRLVAEGVGVANEHIDRLDAKVDRIEAKVDRLETQVDHLDTKLDHIEARVERLESPTN